MLLFEGLCAAIVIAYVAAKLRFDANPRAFAARFCTLVAAAWLGEHTVIEAYGFYVYSRAWSLFVGHVPLMIVLIWPMVIHSAWDLARSIAPHSTARVPLLAGLFVLADASLIEPVAVGDGLWTWTEPGLFDIPPIGILGWAIFTVLAVSVLQKGGALRHIVGLIGAVAVTHAVLSATWWAALRWINVAVPDWPVAIVAALLSIACVYGSWTRQWRRRIPFRDMALRAPAATVFFVLLALQDPPVALVVYVLAFVPPYLALIDFRAIAAGQVRA